MNRIVLLNLEKDCFTFFSSPFRNYMYTYIFLNFSNYKYTSIYESINVGIFTMIHFRFYYILRLLWSYFANESLLYYHIGSRRDIALVSKCDLVKDCDTIVVSCRSEVQRRINNELSM